MRYRHVKAGQGHKSFHAVQGYYKAGPDQVTYKKYPHKYTYKYQKLQAGMYRFVILF